MIVSFCVRAIKEQHERKETSHDHLLPTRAASWMQSSYFFFAIVYSSVLLNKVMRLGQSDALL
jgi:hypothetical protein